MKMVYFYLKITINVRLGKDLLYQFAKEPLTLFLIIFGHNLPFGCGFPGFLITSRGILPR